MKAIKIFGIAISVVVISLILFGIFGPETDYEKGISKQDSVTPTEVNNQTLKEEKALFERNVNIVDSLKNKFHFEKDEFNNDVWINHKQFGKKYWPNRNTLVVYIRKDGSYYMQSNYYGNDWVFHTKVVVKLGDNVITSESINTFDKRHRTDVSGGTVWEINQYTANTPDLAKAISLYTGKEPVKVRFQGDQHIKDITLSDKDRKAINETILFAEALQATWNKIGAADLPL